MTDFMIGVIWLGGVAAAPAGYGFFKTMFWPYQLGKHLFLWVTS